MKITDRIHAILWNDPYSNNANTYLLRGSKNILIDPGHRHLFGRVEDYLLGLKMTVADIDALIITHCHPDHLEAASLFSSLETVILMHEIEMDFLRAMAHRYGGLFCDSLSQTPALLQEGDLAIGDMHMRVIHTPGHSPGSICLFLGDEKVLITGDLVFLESVGRTDLPGGDGKALKNSIKRIAGLGAETLLPGHGELVEGSSRVEKNFELIESYWFHYL